MTTDMALQSRLTKVFHEVFEDESLQLVDRDGPGNIAGWDSLAHVNLIVSLEDEFNVKFSTVEIASLQTVGDIKRLLNEKIQ